MYSFYVMASVRLEYRTRTWDSHPFQLAHTVLVTIFHLGRQKQKLLPFSSNISLYCREIIFLKKKKKEFRLSSDLKRCKDFLWKLYVVWIWDYVYNFFILLAFWGRQNRPPKHCRRKSVSDSGSVYEELLRQDNKLVSRNFKATPQIRVN
jgi:hypothetical protein